MKRGEDGYGDFGLGDEGDDAEAAAAGASQGVEVVDALEEGGPVDAVRKAWSCFVAHGGGRCGWRQWSERRDGCAAWRGRRRSCRVAWCQACRGVDELDDVRAKGRVRSEDAVKTDERMARRRDEGAKASQELEGSHDAVGAAALRSIDSVGDAAVFEQAEALEAERRAGAVAE